MRQFTEEQNLFRASYRRFLEEEIQPHMAEWREADGGPVEGDAQEVANATAARLETEYDAARIRTLIENEGWATPEG